MGQSAKNSKGYFIGNLIGHSDSVLGFGKMMFVMPHPVRAKALFINKVAEVFYLRHFGNPIAFYKGQNVNRVTDDLACKHFSGYAGSYPEIHFRWCDRGKIFGI